MRIIFNTEYIFIRKKDSKMFLMKSVLDKVIELNHGTHSRIFTKNYICSGKNWREITVTEFKKLDLIMIGNV